MKNNYIKAVIVDSGLNSSRKFSSNNKVSQFKFKNKKGIISEKPQDNIGHGTAVSSIIDKNVTNTHLLMVRLFYEDYKVDESNLINLLKYIYKNLNVDLIHLSNGITRCNKLNLLKKFVIN